MQLPIFSFLSLFCLKNEKQSGSSIWILYVLTSFLKSLFMTKKKSVKFIFDVWRIQNLQFIILNIYVISITDSKIPKLWPENSDWNWQCPARQFDPNRFGHLPRRTFVAQWRSFGAFIFVRCHFQRVRSGFDAHGNCGIFRYSYGCR